MADANTEGLTVKQCAQALSVHTQTVRRYIREGRVHWTKTQGRYGPEYRISAESVESLKAQRITKRRKVARESLKEQELLSAIEALTQRLESLEETIQRLLPPAPEEQPKRRWWQLWQPRSNRGGS